MTNGSAAEAAVAGEWVEENLRTEVTMYRILVGVDTSAAAADALAWAVALGDALAADVHAVNSFENPFSEVPPDEHEQLRADRANDVTDWISTRAVAGGDVDAAIIDGDPRQTLLSEAESEGADLLVLGRTGSGGGPGFLHLGSVVEHAAHHSQIPIAVIPPGWRRPPETVVVGVDGSPESLAAVAWVSSLAPIGPRVAVVQVTEPLVEWTPATSPDNWRRDAERDLEAWVEPLIDAGLSVVPVAQRDLHPADGLIGVAASRNADLLVVGMRGVGGFRGLRAGGVSLKVLHRAAMPLVLVPAR